MANVSLYNQDCVATLKSLKADSVDLIVTDPPYNLGNFMKDRDTNLSKMRDNFFGSAGWDDMNFSDWRKSMNDFFKAAAKVMKKGGSRPIHPALLLSLPLLLCLDFPIAAVTSPVTKSTPIKTISVESAASQPPSNVATNPPTTPAIVQMISFMLSNLLVLGIKIPPVE